jgi:ABC-2 type transport system permease protein
MADAPQPARPSPSFAYAAMRVFDLSIGDMLWSRRTVFMALVTGVPVVIAVVVRALSELGGSPVSVNNTSVTGPVMFGLMIWGFFIRFSVPVLGVFYGTSLIADEVEDKTITYLFSRPIPRGAVLVGKYLAYLACTIFVVLPAVILVWLLMIPMGGSLGPAFPDLLKDLGVLALGIAVYGAVFALAGAALKRPLLIGLVFVLGWEPLVVALPGYLRRFSVAHYLQGLVPHAMP